MSPNLMRWPCNGDFITGTELEAARVKKPRDKGAVEGAVYKVYKHIYAKIRDEVFYSLDELNSRIFELLDAFNSKCMYGRESRDRALQ